MEQLTYTRHKVFDPLLRLIHAWLGIFIIAQILTVLIADYLDKGVPRDTLWHIHIWFGYAIAGGFIMRLLWGFIGPTSARWADLWHPKNWLILISKREWRDPPRWGHSVMASGAYLVFYIALIAMLLTGLSLAAIKFNIGPFALWLGGHESLKDLFHEPHEFIYNIIIGFIIIHLGALLFHEIKDKTPLAQAMISGFKYHLTTQEEKK